MNKDQGSGIIERVIYGAIFWVAMRAVAKGWIDQTMAEYIATGGVMLFGGAWGWWHNRPVSVLNRAGEAIPQNAKLVIATTAAASPVENIEAHALANAASDKVVAQTQ